MKFDPSGMPNGTILLMGITYEQEQPTGDTRGRAIPKVFDYTLIRTGGLWYTSGAGQSPQAAGWGAVERWLGKNNRKVQYVKVVTETVQLWPSPEPPEQTKAARLLAERS